MRLLLDTHIFIWLATEPERLNAAERQLLSDGSIALLLSVVSLWEVRIKWDARDRDGRRKGAFDPAAARTLAAEMMEVVSLTAETTTAELRIALEHADPFDRLLLAQTQELGVRLLTRDAKLRAHPLALVP